jgi:hypothetical protein
MPNVPSPPGRSALRLVRSSRHPVDVFVRYYVDLDAPFEQVESRLLDMPARWVPGIFTEAEERGTELLADVGFALGDERRIEKRVEVRIGPPHRTGRVTTIPLRWSATGARALFPSLDADFELAALGERRSQLSLSARYEPPLGSIGRVLDRALLHRVAEAAVRDFIDRVVEEIGAAAHAPSL